MLRLVNLKKSFGERKVLDDLSLTLMPGEVYGLLGANGAGKTTTINIICRLLNQDGGEVWLGENLLSDANKKLIGIAPQENLLYKSLSCGENLRFFGDIYGLSKKDCDSQIKRCLDAVNLGDRIHSPADTLSGGMQRRINIAIALMHQPKLLILDEPTTGLDIETRYEIWSLIEQLRQQGMTILLTTHLLDEAERLCQKIGILQGGQLLAEGDLNTLKQVISAEEIITVSTPEEEAAIDIARGYGFTPRYYGDRLSFWVPELVELKTLIDYFSDIEINSIARQPVSLEHIYLELTRPRK
ncbi:MAG: ABC transporter ATP-binding protein [Cyanobacteria bacterium P01_C01_bin.89]